MRSLIDGSHPACVRSGPVLAAATYPDVLVARADSDGQDLDLVLRPGAGPTHATLTLDRLAPNTFYQVTGADEALIKARDDGTASIRVALRTRTEVHVSPVRDDVHR